jgi:hypothetical protein
MGTQTVPWKWTPGPALDLKGHTILKDSKIEEEKKKKIK